MRHSLVVIAALFTLAACENGWTPISDPALAAHPPSSYASPFGHGFKDTEITGPGLLLDSWAGNLGGAISESGTDANRKAEKSAFAAPVGQPISWHAEKATIRGKSPRFATITTMREFRQSVTLNGATRDGMTKACQQPDGSWKIAH